MPDDRNGDDDSIRFRVTRTRQTLTTGDDGDDLPDGGLLVSGGIVLSFCTAAFVYYLTTLLSGTVGAATVPFNVAMVTLFGLLASLIAVRTVARWSRWRRSRRVWRPASRTPGSTSERRHR